METATAKLIETIFSEAISRKDEAARESYVKQACQGDIELFEEVKQLIAAHENAADFLTEAAQGEVVLAQTARPTARQVRLESSAQPPELEDERKPVFDPPTKALTNEISRPEISGFQIGKLLGKGGLGVVYQAFDEKLQRQVALKVLLVGKSDELRNRVLAEARKAASLIDPGIVTIYSVHDEGATPAVSMELVEGFPIDRAT
ncbi:MAG: prkC 3, partial [Verrucomicrobiales bacterium]|nr:prkC 3 [Verrucomicrobiales bacterium]